MTNDKYFSIEHEPALSGGPCQPDPAELRAAPGSGPPSELEALRGDHLRLFDPVKPVDRLDSLFPTAEDQSENEGSNDQFDEDDTLLSTAVKDPRGFSLRSLHRTSLG